MGEVIMISTPNEDIEVIYAINEEIQRLRCAFFNELLVLRALFA